MIAPIRASHPEVTTRALCRLLGVSRATVHRHARRRVQADRDAPLRERVEGVVLEFAGYGYRRVTRHLAREGTRANHKRVLRVMREGGLLCRRKRHRPVTTDSRHDLQRYPNLIDKLEPARVNQVWQADLTYVRLGSGFVYLACIVDGYSRRCVGWALSPFVDTGLTLEALEMALTSRRPEPGLIHHSDQGVQYANERYMARLEAVGARPSMSAIGNPYDNAKAESFIKTVKVEEVYLKDYGTYAEARADIGRFIEAVYNERRLHSSLGYRPPAEFEEMQSVEPKG
jgi:transposase InsO family protein